MLYYVLETLSRGGAVMYFLFAVSVAAWYLILKKYSTVSKEHLAAADILLVIHGQAEGRETPHKERKSIISSIAHALKHPEKGWTSAETVEERRLFYHGLLDSSMGTISLLAAVSPLLGLLGTVNGMMKTFTLIQLHGSANPALMAEGISEALLTTQAGLVVAFPVIIAGNHLRQKIKDIKDCFEIIASSATQG